MSTSPFDQMRDYYNRNAAAFCAETLELDLQHLYERFICHVPPGGRVLDAGCGSGRDSLAFIEMGFQVSAFDASEEMAKRASDATGIEVHVDTFQNLNTTDEFEGIWACASLLHVPRSELVDCLRRLACRLVSGGVLYASFKLGEDERTSEGRYFNDMLPSAYQEYTKTTGRLVMEEYWITEDARENNHARWLNTLSRAVRT